jgi:hypothetical protein
MLVPIEHLQNVLSDESNWCKGWYARDAANETTNVTSGNACKWCLQGAIHLVAFRSVDFGDIRSVKIIDYLKQKVSDAIREHTKDQNREFTGIASFNDSDKTKFEDIKRVLEIAVADAKQFNG